MENRYEEYVQYFRDNLPLKESFDLGERSFYIGSISAKLYFVNGLVDGDAVQWLMNIFTFASSPASHLNSSSTLSENCIYTGESSQKFLATHIPFLDAEVNDDLKKCLKLMLSGKVPILVDGLDKVVIIDSKSFPSRSIEEPEKEKSLRGAKDGFGESVMINAGLIRRRVRDKRLIFKQFVIGEESKTDVALCYMDGVAKPQLIKKLEFELGKLNVNNLTVCEQSLVEQLVGKKGKVKNLNPFPKVRYTQRPDIIAAHITEGKIALLVDNSPTAVLFPVGVFDFFQDIDDYYFPVATGNYLRFIRIVNVFVIMLLSPLYLAFLLGHLGIPPALDFFIPDEGYAIPLFWQFILLEVAIDGLKLASLNTPDSLGMSLSVIGALILGDMAIDCGWFVPHTIFTMAVVALASFTLPSIEFTFAMKFVRIGVLIGVYVAGLWGGGGVLALGLIVIGCTKNLAGDSYLYPLFPFKGKALGRLLFRKSPR